MSRGSGQVEPSLDGTRFESHLVVIISRSQVVLERLERIQDEDFCQDSSDLPFVQEGNEDLERSLSFYRLHLERLFVHLGFEGEAKEFESMATEVADLLLGRITRPEEPRVQPSRQRKVSTEDDTDGRPHKKNFVFLAHAISITERVVSLQTSTLERTAACSLAESNAVKFEGRDEKLQCATLY